MSRSKPRILALIICVINLLVEVNSDIFTDQLDYSSPHENTSILNLGMKRNFLKQVAERFNDRFAQVNIEFKRGENIVEFLSQNADVFHNGSKLTVEISTARQGEDLLPKVEALIKSGTIDLIGSIIIPFQCIICDHICMARFEPNEKPYYPRTIIFADYISNMKRVKKLLADSKKMARLGLKPEGYANLERCYLSPALEGSVLIQLFDFVIVPVKINTTKFPYNFDQFSALLEEQTKIPIRNLGYLKSKPEICLDIFFIDLENNTKPSFGESETLKRYSDLLAKFAWKYGSITGNPVRFPLFQNSFSNQSLTQLPMRQERLIKAIKLNRNLVNGEIDGEISTKLMPVFATQFSTRTDQNRKLVNGEINGNTFTKLLPVIATQFSTILIAAPYFYHNGFGDNPYLTEIFDRVSEFNHDNNHSISAIVTEEYDEDFNSLDELVTLIQLLGRINHKNPGIVEGLILITSFGHSTAQTVETYLTKVSSDGVKIKEALKLANITLLALGSLVFKSPTTIDLNEYTLKMMTTAEETMGSKSALFLHSRTPWEMEEFMDPFNYLVGVKKSGHWAEMWTEVEWSSRDTFRPISNCKTFKIFYEMVWNWAHIHQMHVIVSEAIDEEGELWEGHHERKGWFSEIGIVSGRGTDFVAKVDDPCVILEHGPIQGRIQFNGALTMVSIDGRNLSDSDISSVIQLVTSRFSGFELSVENFHQGKQLIQVVNTIQKLKGGKSSNTIRLSIDINSESLSFLDESLLEILSEGGNLTTLAGFHVFNNSQDSDNICSSFDDKTLAELRGKLDVEVGFVLKMQNLNTLAKSCLELVANFDYVLLDIFFEKIIRHPESFNEMIRMNNLNDFYHVFDTLRGFQHTLRKMYPKVRVLPRFRWPSLSPPKEDTQISHLLTENMLLFWKFINNFCTTFNFTYIMFPAIDIDLHELDGTGWWRVTNSTNLSDLSVYVERESEYFGVDTPKPVNIFVLPDPPSPPPNSRSNDPPPVFPIFGAVGIFALLGIVIAALAFRLHNRNVILSRDEVRNFVEGLKEADRTWEELGLPADETSATRSAYNSSLEIGKNEFRAERSALIGVGNFGIVYKADIQRFDKPVAVKIPQTGGATEAFKSLLCEIKIMSCVADHPNVLKVLGAYTKEIRRGVVYIVTELCEKGSLQTYLRSISRPASIQQLNTYELQRFGEEIASGMEYIGSKNIIHGDLSTRNVLLDSSMVCKICDFGLSRKLDLYGKYVKNQSESLPWRWMSVESLKRLEFSVKSDVWSFGVTVWEIFSLGDIPFAEMCWDSGFVDKLENGDRLHCPKFASPEIYRILERCWDLEPGNRVDFNELVTSFNHLRSQVYTTVIN